MIKFDAKASLNSSYMILIKESPFTQTLILSMRLIPTHPSIRGYNFSIQKAYEREQ